MTSTTKPGNGGNRGERHRTRGHLAHTDGEGARYDGIEVESGWEGDGGGAIEPRVKSKAGSVYSI